MAKDKRKVGIAAVGDIHCTKSSQGAFQSLFSEINEKADVLVLCGDLTDYGLPEEAHVLARELATLKVPVLGVLGNHDFESGKQAEVTDILAEAGLLMLDGDAHEVAGVGFAGTKGFAGGFGKGTLSPWGEGTIKLFVQEGVNEAMKLERAVARLRTPHKIVVLHYAPIQATVEGEPEAIFPFLGTSRLEEPLARYPVSAVFHGHAHRGTLEGRTMSGSPVYNVSLPLLKRDFPNKPPFYLFEVSDEGKMDMPIDGRVTADV
ncbi:MAG TPA: metallophosphoesterase [Chloroflexia bacterium]|jgi:Icc-related predicted phosphoesterase